MTMSSTQISNYWLILFYKGQLRKFNKLGLGRKTENRVIITRALIQATERRINQLRTMEGELA